MQTVCEVWQFKVFVPELAAHAPRLQIIRILRTLDDNEMTTEI